MEILETVSEKNKRMLIVNGGKFRFIKDVKTTNEIFWKCSRRNCPAKVWTLGKCIALIKYTQRDAKK